MTTATLQALTAAGVTFTAKDFANPNLDQPTALTVTADGRVFGHLAKWGTCHIGHTGQCVTPPSSTAGYRFFHQGVVRTDEGDLPVGKITLGTGHAALGENAVAAAAHYDHTGAVVATVRAGEDEHGIWLAGRLVPGTAPERVDELRRSGVSGDWRGVDGAMELVAALAVNVPGFPVPRTEQLVAAGGLQTLVAAGVVTPPEPVTVDDLTVLVASAVAERVDVVVDQRLRLAAARATMTSLVASANADRRKAARDEIARVEAARAAETMELTASAPGHMPSQLHQYWTRGAGLARWAETAHPFTSLVRALRQEIAGKPDATIKGIAANLYKSVFGSWPGDHHGAVTAAGSGRRVRSQQGADRYGVSVGDLIPKAMLQAQQTAGDFAQAAGNDVAKLLDPSRGKKKDDKKKPADGDGARMDAHTEAKASPTAKAEDPKTSDAPKAKDAAVDTSAKDDKKPAADKKPTDKPAEKETAKKDTAKNATKVDPAADGLEQQTLDSSQNTAKPDNAQAKPAQAKSVPATAQAESAPPAQAAPAGDGGGDGPDSGDPRATYFPKDYPPAVSDYADQEVGTPIDTVAPARLADNGGQGGPMQEDEIPDVGANGGALVDYDSGMAIYADGSVTDGTEWTAADSQMIENAAASRALDMQESAADDPATIQTDVPPRASGYGVYMEEDQSPEVGANGGALVDYSDGVAQYDDGSQTNGVVWSEIPPAPEPTPEQVQAEGLAASAHRRVMRRMGFRPVPAAWKNGGARPKA